MTNKSNLKRKSEIVDFCQCWFNFTPYPYQEKFLNACMTNKRVTGLWCRQSGKSFNLSAYLTFRAITECITIVIASPTQNQSDELYEKIREFVVGNPLLHDLIIKDTARELKLATGSRILSLPEGNEGRSMRGYTADIVVLEEAGVIGDKVVSQVVIPMIASKPNGQVIKIGTPLGKNHFYRSCYDKESEYVLVKVDWREVVEVGQYSKEFIKEQKRDLLDIEFRQEYEAEFVEDENAFFEYSLVKQSQEGYQYLII